METMHDLLKIWLPFIILVAVWIFFMRRLRGGSSFQKDVLEEMKVQTKAQADIAHQLNRIATALEQHKP